MEENIQISKSTSFYLHSNKNCRLYPSSKYPITHLLDHRSIQNRLSKQPIYVKRFIYLFISLLSLIVISTIFFQIHILIYNSIFGPFHFNLEQFIKHINNYENGQSWFRRIEYIQIELDENNIQNPISTYDTIRKYSDPYTRRNHIATYKKVKKPSIYVKLPTRGQNHFHTHLSFRFQSYSISTLRCIVINLRSDPETTYKTWVEKSEYVEYINEQYTKNSSLFNMLVLTKCGILIGYLYRPVHEKAFIPTREHKFYKKDLALDVTRQYCSFYPLIMFSFISFCLFAAALFYLLLYLSNLIRYKIFHKYGFLSFPLDLFPNVLDELWVLNSDDLPHKQLLQLDESMQRSKHKTNNQLFIIKNNFEQLFVIILKLNLSEKCNVQDNQSPFIICPVTDIRKIVQYGGICYGNDSSWIPWPSDMTNEQNYSEWLHEELMQISEHYKKQYEHRLRHELGDGHQPSLNDLNSGLVSNHNNNNDVTVRRRGRIPEIRSIPDDELSQLIHEEENFQRLKSERQHWFERFVERSTPASPQFIAEFRIRQKLNENVINSIMENEHTKCVICYEEFELNEPYAKWPCPSKIPHLFHNDCMLNTLRTKNTCPICRHPVEAMPLLIPNDAISQFFARFARQ